MRLGRPFSLLLGLLIAGAGAAEHRVQPKAKRDDPRFSLRAHALADGAILASYARPGAAAQSTLVLVPETHGDRTQFQEPSFLENLPADLPVVIIESRGQGRSWPPPAPAQATIERYASDVLEVVAQHGLTNWIIGGHSLGGMIAIEIAGRRPAGLRGVVALEGWTHSRVQRQAFPAAARTDAQAADARAQREERYRSQRWTPEEAAALPRAWTEWESGERILRETHLPVLSVWGDRGQLRPTRAQLLLPERANIELSWIAGADHYVVDAPHAAETARAISRFVARVAAAPHVTAAAPLPNIVMILIDDLGYGDLGCYGSTKHRTPHLDRLAAGGLRFTDFHSNGAVCSPTRTALLTGLYPQRAGIEAAIGFTLNEGVALSFTTIAEVLAPRGYRGGVFGKWHVGHVTRFGPNDQGFHESWCSNNNPDYHSHVSRDGNVDWWRDQRLADEPGYLVDRVTAHAVGFIRGHQARPFFLYVPQLAVHFPWQGRRDPAHRTTGREWNGDDRYGPLPKAERPRAYREMVEAVDDSVGQIVAALDAAGVRERTLVFVCSDNGAYLSVGSNGPFRGEKGDLHEGGHRVAAIANWPGRIAAGRTTDVTAMTMDLLPTFAALTGAPLPAGLRPDGVDLSGVLLRGEPLAPRTLFWRDADEKAVRRGPWKLVVRDTAAALYNLDTDPAERLDLAAKQPARLRELESGLAAWERDVGPRRR
ncbi:MAG: alpha/beta fold hydrolase [Opitutus sp.]|nr:alpha/beta fold hydrolase [Opitutus sp.]